MSPAELEQYLYTRIPLTRAIEVAVTAITPERVVLSAPLAPNVNHHGTGFGGSASALGILAAWGLLYTRLLSEGVRVRLVIRRNSVEYLRPITGTFTASGTLEAADSWARFLKTLQRKDRAQITASSVLECEGQSVARFTGDFVALNPNP